jgi:hypothetical protein
MSNPNPAAGSKQVALTGSIDERTNFQTLIGETGKSLVLDLSAITRVNSSGIRSWKQYFDGLNKAGVDLLFTKASPPIVEQIAIFKNFLCGGRLDSMFVPFLCTKCDKNSEVLFTVEQLKQINFQIKEIKCKFCAGKAEFDDDPDLYFNFLKG